MTKEARITNDERIGGDERVRHLATLWRFGFLALDFFRYSSFVIRACSPSFVIRHSPFLVILLAIVFTTPLRAEQSLKDAFRGRFLIGAALNRSQFYEENTNAVALIKAQFNSITPENALKWASLHPNPDGFDFADADRYVAFGEKNKMFIVGHTLIWHNQTPRWVFQDDKGNPVDRETLLRRMKEHITTVVGRYKGRVGGWDVVNEALEDSGKLRQTPWFKIIGEDYLAKAFQYAHEADPKAELYYNDFSLEHDSKRKGAIELIKNLKAQGLTVTGVGSQEHNKMDSPTAAQVDAAISDLSKLGIKVMITELDVDPLPPAIASRGADVNERAVLRKEINPYTDGFPEEMQQKLAARYAELFKVFVKHSGEISRITFWGVSDRDSWLNDWPARGRTSYPLLFDRNGQPKPAFAAVLKTAQ